MRLPALTRPQAIDFLHNNYPALDPSSQIIVLGMRGYFDPGTNKRGIYDDAIGLVTPTEFLMLNGNTDPSVTRPGIAVLQDGVYYYRKGLHGISHLNTKIQGDRDLLARIDDIKTFQQTWQDIKMADRILPYWALRQDSDVTVLRDGSLVPYTDTPPRPRMWIDIHCGGFNVTSSEGCQTIYPTYWGAFRKLVFTQMDLHNQPRIAYALKTLTLSLESRPV